MPKISAYPAGDPIQASDQFVIARAGANDKILGSELIPQQGVVHNGKISVTVAGNNLTLALKTLAGGNPSVADPVFIYIGGGWRAITAALSVTKNAGTNWCNAGSSELATKEIDYFAYLGYNATDGVVIGFSRIPFATVYLDFSTTSTNEKYCAISTIATAAAADEYVVIGRFAATLSAGAGYTWSVPVYNAANLIQRPIYETRNLSYATVITYGGGSTSPTSNTPSVQTYCYIGRIARVQIISTLVRGGGDRTQTIFSVPFTITNSSPVNATENITAAGLRVPPAQIATTSLTITSTMANDGTYRINGFVLYV